MTKPIDTVTIRSRLEALSGFTKKAWSATGFCRVRREDGSWHESSKISVQRGVYGSMSPQDARLAAAAPELHAVTASLCDELDEARAEIARLRAELVARPLPRGELDGASLDERLKAKGMLTVGETMQPMNCACRANGIGAGDDRTDDA